MVNKLWCIINPSGVFDDELESAVDVVSITVDSALRPSGHLGLFEELDRLGQHAKGDDQILSISLNYLACPCRLVYKPAQNVCKTRRHIRQLIVELNNLIRYIFDTSVSVTDISVILSETTANFAKISLVPSSKSFRFSSV